MLVWLSSYPRSGNTFVRILLSEAFGIKTYSLHGDNDPHAFGSATVTRLVGHKDASQPAEELVTMAHSSDGMHIIKTHEHPLSNDPCIFVVRDGRSAVVSYYHFLKEIAKTPLTLEQVIKGHVFAGSWSQHYIAWQPKLRPHTLLLRYESIISNPSGAITEIASFLRLNPVANFSLTFESLKSLNPNFFRSGSDENNIAELGSQSALFWDLHEPVMSALHYDR